MRPFGADPHWHKSKVYTEPSGVLIYPETDFSPDNIHVHDYLSGGPISMNMWHSLFLTAQFGNSSHDMFYKFCTWYDIDGAPYEAPEGTPINHTRNPPNVHEESNLDAMDVPKYLPVWQFLYSADKIEARYGGVV